MLRNGIFLLFLLFITIPMHAQENELKFHSTSFGAGVLETPLQLQMAALI